MNIIIFKWSIWLPSFWILIMRHAFHDRKFFCNIYRGIVSHDSLQTFQSPSFVVFLCFERAIFSRPNAQIHTWNVRWLLRNIFKCINAIPVRVFIALTNTALVFEARAMSLLLCSFILWKLLKLKKNRFLFCKYRTYHIILIVWGINYVCLICLFLFPHYKRNLRQS